MKRPVSYREQPCCDSCIFATFLGKGHMPYEPVLLCHYGDHEDSRAYWCPPKHARKGADKSKHKAKREKYIEDHCVSESGICDVYQSSMQAETLGSEPN